jgi:hypothetical protein
MAAIDTFDWYTARVWNDLDEETREYVRRQRRYLLGLKCEDARKRFVSQFIKEMFERNRKITRSLRGA